MERAEIHDLSAAYALDALDADERVAFEEHLAHCGECRSAVASFQDAAAELAYDAEAPPPPPALRERILAEAAREHPNVVPLRRRRWALPVAATVAAAAAVIAVALGIWAVDLSRQLDDERAASQSSREAAQLLADPTARHIPLEGADGVLVVDAEGKGWLVVRGLDEAPSDKTYEAWVVQDDRTTAAGIFAGGGAPTVVALADPVPDGARVAVTVEQEGGVEQPTQEPVFVTGEPA
ncbi:MAG TPA: anti-sigma factor [Gaiellaceae bacterium]|jgi:anti-sigma-K factor RskA|nr:anti-sigma factor [Gaiellaceae bacterium]